MDDPGTSPCGARAETAAQPSSSSSPPSWSSGSSSCRRRPGRRGRRGRRSRRGRRHRPPHLLLLSSFCALRAANPHPINDRMRANMEDNRRQNKATGLMGGMGNGANPQYRSFPSGSAAWRRGQAQWTVLRYRPPLHLNAGRLEH
eukprot:5278013-Pyramimonas_sp.AAC.1